MGGGKGAPAPPPSAMEPPPPPGRTTNLGSSEIVQNDDGTFSARGKTARSRGELNRMLGGPAGPNVIDPLYNRNRSGQVTGKGLYRETGTSGTVRERSGRR